MTKTHNPTIEAQRSQLKLRRMPSGTWQVYASIHGTSTYKWWMISDEKKDWYLREFPEIPVIPYLREV
jgi:hypothetical protein